MRLDRASFLASGSCPGVSTARGEKVPGSPERDRDGKRVLDPSDEVIAVVADADNKAKRGSKDVRIPSKSSKVPEPRTDSEASSPTKGKQGDKRGREQQSFAKPEPKGEPKVHIAYTCN